MANETHIREVTKMVRLIDANALSDAVAESKHNNPHPQGMIRVNHRNEHDHFLRMILYAPTVDAVEVVHGEWGEIYTCHGERLWGYKCSQCEQDNPNKSNYCPNCGAKMDGGNEDV